MANLLKNVLSLIDDKLEDVFNRKAPDAPKARAKALKTIETAKRQFASVEPSRGRKAWKVNNDVVAFDAGYAIGGHKIAHVPVSRFSDFLDNLEKAIEAGELDDALVAEDAGEIPTSVIEKAKRGGPRGKRGPLSPESLAARRAKVAAKAGA